MPHLRSGTARENRLRGERGEQLVVALPRAAPGGIYRPPRARARSPPTIVVGDMPRIPINISELVGDTPLVGLPQMLEGPAAADSGVELFAKLESRTPAARSRTGSAWR